VRRRFIIGSALVLLLAIVASWSAAVETPAPKTAPAPAAAKFASPILISSAGQSADVKMVGMMTKRLQLDAKVEMMAKPDQLAGVKTLIVVPGFSSKGLGAAGISQKDEMARVTALLLAADQKKIPILLVHIGGTARRLGQSDAFNEVAAKHAKYMLVVEQGNSDGFFTKLAGGTKTPLELVKKIPDTTQALEKLFK
jgi:hypothetical protein